MNKERLNLLKELTEASGVSGHEREVRDVLKKHLKGRAEVSQDRMGSIVFKKKGTADNPRIMIPGHMDELGFMVKCITEEGCLRFIRIRLTGSVKLAEII